MTTPIHFEVKRCDGCGAQFQRRPSEWPNRFIKRRYCSKTCAQRANGAKAARRPPLTMAEILRAHIATNKESGCVEWTGAKNSDGYGVTSIQGYRGAHQLAFFLTRGPIPDGMQVLHSCDNPACVTPGHLFLGTHADNMADKISKNRQHRLLGEANGRAKLTSSASRGNPIVAALRRRSRAVVWGASWDR